MKSDRFVKQCYFFNLWCSPWGLGDPPPTNPFLWFSCAVWQPPNLVVRLGKLQCLTAIHGLTTKDGQGFVPLPTPDQDRTGAHLFWEFPVQRPSPSLRGRGESWCCWLCILVDCYGLSSPSSCGPVSNLRILSLLKLGRIERTHKRHMELFHCLFTYLLDL